MTSRAILALLLLLQGWNTHANPYLPDLDKPIRYSGVQWNDEWQGDSAIQAEGKFSSVAKFDAGEIVKFSLATTGKPKHPRTFPEFLFWVTNEGAIYRLPTDDTKQAPKVEPLDIVVPVVTEEGKFGGAPKSSGDVPIISSEYGWRWTSAPWTTEIATDNGGLVMFRSYHPSGHFTRMLWQRGLGITEISMGSGARQDGWELHRTAAPAGKVTANDVAVMLAGLPAEFFPSTQALTSLEDLKKRAEIAKVKTNGDLPELNARIQIDRANGWLELSSNTEGEGETLNVVLWKRKDGSPLLIMALQKWDAGPTTTSTLRAVEFRDGTFRHVTTTLPLPTEGDFYTSEEAEKRPPGRLVEGKWVLPQKGSTITIRPPNEEGAELIPESFTSDETYYFELTWDGSEFQSNTLPRVIPAPPYEPKEWAFQSSDPKPRALFLQRNGTELKGVLQELNKTTPVTGTINPDGLEIKLTVGGKLANVTKLQNPEGNTGAWEDLTIASDLGGDQEVVFEAIPIDPQVRNALPRYKIAGFEETPYPQFEVSTADWKAINTKIASFIKSEQEDFKKASKGAEDEPMLNIEFEVVCLREYTVSLVFMVHRYVGGPHGQIHFVTFNYDFKTHSFLKGSDVFNEGWQTKVAKLLNAELIKEGGQEEGQNLITEEQLNTLPWTFASPNDVRFYIAPETLNSTNTEYKLTIGYEDFNKDELIKSGGAMGIDRD